MEVPHELHEVGFLLDHHGLVPVLEEVADSVVAAVEGARVAREERTHAPGQRALPRPDQEVGVVREQGPRVDDEPARVRKSRKARKEIGSVLRVPKDGSPFDPSHHHVVQDPRRIQTRASWHGIESSTIGVFEQRPLCPSLMFADSRGKTARVQGIGGPLPSDTRNPARPSCCPPGLRQCRAEARRGGWMWVPLFAGTMP